MKFDTIPITPDDSVGVIEHSPALAIFRIIDLAAGMFRRRDLQDFIDV